MSGEPIQGGRRLSVSRFIKFKFPTDRAGPEAVTVEVENEPGTMETYRRGMFLRVSSQSSQYRRAVYVALVEAIFAAQGQAEVALYVLGST